MVLAALSAILSCKKPLMDTMPRWYSRGPRSYMSEPAGEDSSAWNIPGGKGVYIAAIRFPEWAKWREGDFRGAEAILIRDTVVVAKVQAGPRPEPGRIRILDGHLWTSIADGGTTELFCDGAHRLTIPEEELLKGLLLDSGSIHTLGQRPGGSGISYRIDGKEVFSSGTGTVTGEMTRDTSGTYFVYGIPIRKGDSATMEYHIMNGADEIRCVSPTENGTIYDIKVRDGTVYRSEKRGASASSLCLVVGDTYHSVNAGADESVHLCKLTETGGEMTIKGYSVQGNRKWHWIRSREGVMCRVDTPGVQDFYVDGSAVAFVVNGKDGFVGSIHAGGAQYWIEEKRYRLSSSACADFRGGVFAAALSDTSGREHRLFLDGQLVPMEFNGYFTELKIIE